MNLKANDVLVGRLENIFEEKLLDVPFAIEYKGLKNK